MKGIEKQYLRNCIKALCHARLALLRLSSEDAVEVIPYGKIDSLRLDAVPEIIISKTLCQEFDPHLPLITEEIGSSKKLKGSEDQLVCFSDPMDRSKVLRDFLKRRKGLLEQIFQEQRIIQEWEEKCGGDIELSGPYGSITGIRHGQILFCVMINYITGTLYIASKGYVGCIPFDAIFSDLSQKEFKRTKGIFENVNPLQFGAIEQDLTNIDTKFVAYCKGKEYEDNLVESRILGRKGLERIRQEHLAYDLVGGPARILYLQSPSQVGFILANGEKIIEWIGWLAFVKFSQKGLFAFELSFDSSWTRDGILMAPSNAYSVLGEETGIEQGHRYKILEIALNKLKYFRNPSQYRSTIVVCPAVNQRIITDMAAGLGTELRFSPVI